MLVANNVIFMSAMLVSALSWKEIQIYLFVRPLVNNCGVDTIQWSESDTNNISAFDMRIGFVKARTVVYFQ